jgi:hypothetical protein
MADTAVVTEAELEPTRARHRLRVAVTAAAVGVAALAAFAWWSGTGARLDPGGNGVGATALVVGVPTYIGFDLTAHGGSLTIDDVRLARPPAGVTSEFFVAGGECPIGATASVPDSCDLQPVQGEVVAAGSSRWLVAKYVLTGAGAVRPGDVAVSYHDGLHRRTTDPREVVCLATPDAAAACRDLSHP